MRQSRTADQSGWSVGARACIENGQRLLQDAQLVEFCQPPSTQYVLVVIAQEEFAKAFMLGLLDARVLPFSRYVRRAMNDHACKHLVGVIMDYVIMHWESIEEVQAMVAADADAHPGLPDDVGSAIEMLRYEKIGRWESRAWTWESDPAYHGSVKKVAEGAKDRRKQDALYVRLDRLGHLVSTPGTITEREAEEELRRAERYRELLRAMSDGARPSHRLERVLAALRRLFGVDASGGA